MLTGGFRTRAEVDRALAAGVCTSSAPAGRWRSGRTWRAASSAARPPSSTVPAPASAAPRRSAQLLGAAAGTGWHRIQLGRTGAGRPPLLRVPPLLAAFDYSHGRLGAGAGRPPRADGAGRAYARPRAGSAEPPPIGLGRSLGGAVGGIGGEQLALALRTAGRTGRRRRRRAGSRRCRRGRPSRRPARNDVLAAAMICVRVLRVLRGGVGRARERLLELALTVASVICAGVCGAAAICGRERRRVAGGQQRAEDRLHDRAAEVALEVGGARRHAGAADRHRAGQRVRRRRAGEADADPDERVAERRPASRRCPRSTAAAS